MLTFLELLLALVLVILSTLVWRKRGLTQTINIHSNTDASVLTCDPNTTHNQFNQSDIKRKLTEHPDHLNVVPSSVQTAPVQTPATIPAGHSVAVNVEHGGTATAAVFSSNTFSGPVHISVNPTTPSPASSDGSVLQKFFECHKIKMKKKTECIFEGKKDNKTQLKKVYTQLFITEGKLIQVNNEREMLKIDKDFRTQKPQDTPINCNDIFNLPWKNEENKVVLTKGIAGIGKTVSVHKFILDWVEGEANQDIDCVFFLPFREINLINPGEYSLHELLLEFHPELEELKETKTYENCKLAFIFDGLDESRLPLDFNSSIVSRVKMKATVNVLITNLIRGDLLPSSVIWITSRPAAANQVPSEYVSLFTEVRGFTDKQKEEYFKKRIPDETEASKIISHIKTSRSLYIMCHIPVFCWITATVLQTILVENQGEDIPTTLTEMYIHFLLIQINTKNQKYEQKFERDLRKLMKDNTELIKQLAKLAFIQLTKKHIMFYEDELKECGIDVSKDFTEYSGMCAEIFKQQSILHEEKVYCFIHLSVQEFLAALHVFYCYLQKDMDKLQFFIDDGSPVNIPLDLLLKKAIDKAKQSENSHLDLFLRFLLGISHESNQKLLQGLLGHTENTKKSISKTIQHIKQMQNKGPDLSPEISINHFFCLLELKDRSLYNQIKKYLNVQAFPDKELSLSNCSALAYMLLMSEEVLDEFNPKKYNKSNDACRRLVPAVRCCRKAVFAGCELSETCWETISAALQTENSPLKELDLSDNCWIEQGAKLLSEGLKSLHCKLEKLKLARCHYTDVSCKELASAINSKLHQLKELDLSNNDLQDSGLKQLLFGLKSCRLEILRKVLHWCNLTEESCQSIYLILKTSSESSLKELDLSNNDLQDSGVKLLSAGLEKQHCKLKILRLSGCSVTEEGCLFLTSALSLNPSYLTELDLSYNYPGDKGERELNTKLDDPHCKLEILKLDPHDEKFIRPGIKKYASKLTLDPNTIHVQCFLSEENRKFTHVGKTTQYPEHPDRFDTCNQVLSKESLTGRFYWEAEWTEGEPEIAVTYEEIKRKGEALDAANSLCLLGFNDVSWNLICSSYRYSILHNSLEISIPSITYPRFKKVGVYLDWPAGLVSFYGVSSDTPTLTHIYTFCTTFTKPLYAAFGVGMLNSVALSNMT
ncbi:NACHT, LRR and PYD domains-containing protein 12-like [Colossoma macropomum]|uniref:NACHT, LRR and PYD domains-containing protein 12-like n=1 Tax=Colossoma macropomum TaxID=42526 RepID=UPI0018653CF9|nr:NACHT, LRR and PYD domains-containing protein 12-like [Colossoma macropomum]